jgi:DNA-binding CsgD family transcriptional regulator
MLPDDDLDFERCASCGARRPIRGLSRRQKRILGLLAQGYRRLLIMKTIGISRSTYTREMDAILTKLHVPLGADIDSKMLAVARWLTMEDAGN